MLRWLTAGESHGEALTGIIEGLPAHVPITRDDIRASLARRRLGYGRGARMKFEADEVRLLGGVRHGRTLGAPVAIEVRNPDWPKARETRSTSEVRSRRGEAPRRSPPRPDPGLTRGHRGGQHRMAQMGIGHEPGPGRRGRTRRSGPQCPADPAPPGTCRYRRHAEVRL